MGLDLLVPGSRGAIRSEPMREQLRKLLWHPVADLVLVLAILASVSLMIGEALVPEDDPLGHVFERWSQVLTAAFAVELGLRLYVLASFERFLKVYWLDLFAIAPLFRPLRILRVLRLLRLFRMGVILGRWSHRIEATFVRGYREYLVVGVIALTLVLTGAMGIHFLEARQNPGIADFRDALWWAGFTMMAGEPIGVEPRTTLGRVVLLVLMGGGMTVFALLTGTISAVMVDRLRNSLEGREMRLEDLDGHILICGWNRGGPTLVHELARDPRHRDRALVIVVDRPPEDDLEIDYQQVDRERVYVIRKDYTRVQVLEEAGIARISMAILLADATGDRSDQDRDARTVLAALTIENLKKGIFTCVELLHPENAPPLRLAGVEEIVVATEYSGTILAHASLNAGLVRFFDEVLSSSYGNNFYKATVPPDLVGKPFTDAMVALRRDHRAILLSAERKGGNGHWTMHVNPEPGFLLESQDRLVYLAMRPLPEG